MSSDSPMGVSEELGLRREFTLWSAAAVAFAFISPIVALYSIFALVLTSAGPAGWWAFPIVLIGQLLVALVFAELASRWPLDGSVYQWVRRLAPRGLGWITGWLFAWTLAISTASVSYSAALFVGPAFGLGTFDSTTTLLVALAVLAIVTLINAAGRNWIKYLVGGALIAELVGSVGIGFYLIIFHRENDLSILFSGIPTVDGSAYLWSGFAAAVAFVGWSFVGFESASSIAEEVKRPRRAVPKAMIASVLLVAAVVSFSALSVILAIPDLDAALSGEVGDPVVDTLLVQLGPGLAQPIFILFLIAFLATLIAVQTSASRMVFALARDNALPGAAALRKLRERDRMPVNAVVIVAVAAALVMLTTLLGEVYGMLIGFTVGGFFFTFTLVLWTVLVVRVRRGWIPGSFSLGRLGLVITVIAALWALFQFVNIAWPRTPSAPWYVNYAVPLMIGILLLIGLFVYRAVEARMLSPMPVPEDDEHTVSVAVPAARKENS